MPRFEKWHNGHTRPTNWDGQGQPTAYETIKPTIWTGLFYNDQGYATCESFKSKHERDAWLKELMNAHSR